MTSPRPPPRVARPDPVRAVLVALVLPWLAVGLSVWLGPWLQPHWLPLALSVFAAAWLGGVRAGLLATALASVLGWAWLLAPAPTNAGHFLSMAVFVVAGLVFSTFAGRLRRAHLATALALQKAQALFDEAPDGVVVVGPDGRIRDANAAAVRICGHPREVLLRLAAEDVVRPEDVPRVPEEIARIRAGGRGVSNWELRAADGSLATVEVSASALPDGAIVGFLRDVTTRRRLEASLEDLAADFARAQVVAHVGSWRLDVQRDELRWSDEAHRIFRVPVGTPLRYEDFLQRVHPDDRDVVDSCWKAAQRGEPYDLEHRIVVDGEVRWVRERADLEFDDAGALLGGIGIVQDVTERHRLEAERRRAETRYELALRSAELGAWDWDIATGEVVVSSRWAEMRGYRPEALHATVDTWAAGIHPDDRPALMRYLERHLSGESPDYEAEYRVRSGADGWIWVLDRGRVVERDAAGRALRMCGTELDVTERKRAQQHQQLLAELSQAFGASLDLSTTLDEVARGVTKVFADLCVVVLTEDGRVRDATAAARSPEHRWIADLVTGGPDRELPVVIREVLEARRALPLDDPAAALAVWFEQSDEHRRARAALDPRSAIVLPLAARGAVIGALILLASGSTGRFTAADVARAEEIAARAALAVDNARLYRAKEEAVRARDDVLGVVAHDLRNPLFVVVAQASLLARTEDVSDRCRASAASIGRAADRMKRLIQDLLDVTRMESGHLTLDARPEPAAALLQEVVGTQAQVLAERRIALRVEVPGDLPDVVVDRHRLLQVFENLLGNAAKFSAPGAVVTLGATADGDVVTFRVADTGPGISPEHLPHLFDRFWQARKGETQGAGLGLPIAKAIVEAHGGRIRCESTPGVGTTFSFTVPCAAVRPRKLAPV